MLSLFFLVTEEKIGIGSKVVFFLGAIVLFINADDFGRTVEITDRILNCYREGRIHAASAMVFMIDSERAADLARAEHMIPGLHLNFDQDLTSKRAPSSLRSHHRAVSDYLKAKKWNHILYNPFLRSSFDYVFNAQWDEFVRLFGGKPDRVDGHHHQHLCMNMLISDRLPKGIKLRRNFTFGPGEKEILNRFYRWLVDQWLVSRFQCGDCFFSLQPIESKRLRRLFSLSRFFDIEIMTHPGQDEEYNFLLSSDWAEMISEGDEGEKTPEDTRVAS